MTVAVLDDSDVRALGAGDVVGVIRTAVVDAWKGRLIAPPRARAEVGDDLTYVFTVGGQRDGVSGFRVYRSGGGDQLVAVWDATGELRCVVVGDELGARRTGALGAAAADALARRDASVAAVIGTGLQAWTQLWALTAVRELSSVRVWGRDHDHATAFAARASAELGLDHGVVEAVDTTADAVRDADIVVLATRSAVPVIDAGDVADGAHVITVGPKTRTAHELPPALIDRAAVVTCDAPLQAGGYDGALVTGDRLPVHLGAVIAGDAVGRTSPADVTVHVSLGLAGTEVVLAELVWRAGRQADETRGT